MWCYYVDRSIHFNLTPYLSTASSVAPTTSPTRQPSQPTGQPTSQPTNPTSQPTTQPTTRPTAWSSAVVAPYKRGIQLNSVTLSDLGTRGCSVCFDSTYATPTTTSMINACSGPYLFVGAISSYSSTYLVGAFGSATEVQRQTALNTPHLSGGVYWYFTTGESFGFLNSTDLQQNSADVGSTSPASRLSWHVDQNAGGYRAGENMELNSDTTWRKSIYNCPGTSQ